MSKPSLLAPSSDPIFVRRMLRSQLEGIFPKIPHNTGPYRIVGFLLKSYENFPIWGIVIKACRVVGLLLACQSVVLGFPV